MPNDPNENLRFFAGLLRDEIKGADYKVSAAIASSSIILSANFLMLRAESISVEASVVILVASGSALLAVLFAILAILPRGTVTSDGMFYFRDTRTLGAELLLARVREPDDLNGELAKLCRDYSEVITRKYRLVRTALHFLMVSASATSLAVLIRFLGQESFRINAL